MSGKTQIVDNTAARKKRKRRSRFRLILGSAFIVIGLTLFIFRNDIDYYSLRLSVLGMFASSNSNVQISEVSINIDIPDDAAFGTYKESLVVATNTRLSVVRQDGSLSLDQNVSLGSPVVVSGNGRFLVYDRGGRDLLVCSGTAVIARYTADMPIIDAHINDSGRFAVAEEHSELLAKVTMFDSFGIPIYEWNSSSGYVNQIHLEDDSMLVSQFNIESGEVVSSVVLIEVDKEEPVMTTKLHGELILDMNFNTDGIFLFTDSRLIVLDEKSGEILTTFGFGDSELSGYTAGGDGRVALVRRSYTSGRVSSLTILDKRFGILGEVNTNGDIRILEGGGDRFALVYDSGVAVYDISGGLIAEVIATNIKGAVVTRTGKAIFISEGKLIVI